MLWVVLLLVASWLLSQRTQGNPAVIALGLPILGLSTYLLFGSFL